MNSSKAGQEEIRNRLQ